ncbi:hypothetical protein [Shewanella sp. GXUN23E]|uniref:hypothetical protein n=1 Tax=Shewanella sp. GXUN23E TaxID=3422498 RepID=UPI003D7D3909
MSDIYSATFIFGKGQYDEEFYALDNVIAEHTRQTPGYLGLQSCEDRVQNLLINIYYWQGRQGLEMLMQDSVHLKAKQRHYNWLKGYQVIIARVEQSYGDGLLAQALDFPADSSVSVRAIT